MILPDFHYLTERCDATYGNICYTYHNIRVNWQQANASCVELEAQLIDIEDEREFEIMHSLINGVLYCL